MASLLLVVIYLIFISLGLPDSLLGAGWPTMQVSFGVPSSYAGYVAMTVSMLTVVSALLCPLLLRRFHTRWIVSFSVFLSAVGLLGYSFSPRFSLLFLFAVPFGLGAGAIDSVINHYVANHYSGAVMNYLHCFYGLGAAVSPFLMGQALRVARWNEGYRWTSYIQFGILSICLLSLPLWKKSEGKTQEDPRDNAGIREALRASGVPLTLIAFFAYCAGEATCVLWASSYFAGVFPALEQGTVASFGSLAFVGMTLGRILSGLVSNKTGDRFLIRAGTAAEIAGILLILLSLQTHAFAVAGFILVGLGMAPIYPAIVHMAPVNFGKRFSGAVISLEMAFAYVGYTFVPLVYGKIQESFGITTLPFALLLLVMVTVLALEISYRQTAKRKEV